MTPEGLEATLVKILDNLSRFRRQRRFLFGLSVFAVTFTVVVSVMFVLGIYIVNSAECPRYKGDPCDAAPMMAFSLWMMSLPVGLFVGAITVLFTRYYGISESTN